MANSAHTNENKVAQKAKNICEICMRKPGLHYCTQCEQVFCDDCNVSHLRIQLCRNHTCISRSNITADNKAGGCTDHNEDFIYLCEDCNQLICRLCVTKAHRKHAVMDIKEVEKLFGNLTFQETEVTVKKTTLSAEPHDQPKQPKQEKKKYQTPIATATAVKLYRYRCSKCRTERLSEEEPYFNDIALDCAKCGSRTVHREIKEK